MTKSVFLKIES